VSEYAIELNEAGVYPKLYELSDADLRWARTRLHWGGAGNKWPTDAEFDAEFKARRAARKYDRELAVGLPSRWLPPDWPEERGRDGALLPFG
jgi:hypothetical protein